jgi:hypothetical protein
MKKLRLFTFLIFFIPVFSFSQENPDSSRQITIKHSFFANIYTGFYYSVSKEAIPRSGFDFSTGLLGYRADWDDKATVTLIYDVSKTTNEIIVTDSTGNILPVKYNKGSDYTAFLKMAEIDFKPRPWLEISVGQLLTQQFLTFQDKFWGFRYISTTFQELYRFGAPADFGARITYKLPGKLNVSAGAVNGEGPFRRQDNDATIQYFGNMEWFPVKNFSVKAFADYLPAKGKDPRSAISFFAGYKCEKWRLGAEYNRVENQSNIYGNTWEGTSVYWAYKIQEKWHLLARWDNLILTTVYKDQHYLIAGGEYEPYKGIYISLNGRFLSDGSIPWVFMNFGAKF